MKAGLTHSVGQASIGIRILLGVISLITAGLCLTGGRFIAASGTPGRIIAVLLVIPIGFVVFLGSMFVFAPHSRYGRQLDEFVPRLRERKFAIGVTVAFWVISFFYTR